MARSQYDLSRFTLAQRETYELALSEIRRGHKQSHWMWFMFPQIKGLGKSDTAMYYAINDITEATEFLAHPILGGRLITITEALLKIEGRTAYQIFGSPDDLKLRSCMTLFSQVENANPVFNNVLAKYFSGQLDKHTLSLLTSQI